MKRLLLFLLLTVCALGKTNWVTQSGAGAQDGTTLANAWPASFFNNAANWGAGAGKLSPADIDNLGWDDVQFTVQLVVHGSGTSTSARTILRGNGSLTGYGTSIAWSGTSKAVGIDLGTFSNIEVSGMEIYQSSSSNTYNGINLEGGTGNLIQDNYIHDTYENGIGFVSTVTVNSNEIIRHNWLSNISGINQGSTSSVVLELYGNTNLIEYNTVNTSLDRCRAFGTNVVVRNNYWGYTNTTLYPRTSDNGGKYPEHVDGFQSFNPGPLIKFIYERNYDVDNTDPVPSVGGNAHLFLVQDQDGTNGFTRHINRFNIGIRTSGGGPDWQNVSHVYSYNDTYVAINKYLADNGASYGGVFAYTYPSTHTPATSDLADARNVILYNAPGTLGVDSGGPFEFLPTNFTLGTNDFFNPTGSQAPYPAVTASPANLAHVDPLFTDGTGVPGHDDYSLTGSSPLKTAGSGFATAVGSGSGSTALVLSNAEYFSDGYGVVEGDWIMDLTSGGPAVQVSSISGNNVTLASNATWSNADVWIVKGMQSVGALPFAYYTTVMNVSSSTATSSPATLSAATSTIEDVRKVEWLVDGIPVASTNYTGSSPLTATYTISTKSTLLTRAYNFWASGAYGTVEVQQLINQDPSGLTATTVSTSSINLAWTDNSGGLDTFSVERSPNGSTGWTVIGTTAATVVTYGDTGLTTNTTYYYRVRAASGGFYSGYSSTANATTNTPAPAATGGANPSRNPLLLTQP